MGSHRNKRSGKTRKADIQMKVDSDCVFTGIVFDHNYFRANICTVSIQVILYLQLYSLRSRINPCSSMVRLTFLRQKPVASIRFTHLSKAEGVRTGSQITLLPELLCLSSSTNGFFCSLQNILPTYFLIMVFTFIFFKRIPFPNSPPVSRAPGSATDNSRRCTIKAISQDWACKS